MDRKAFIIKCGKGCLSVITSSLLLDGCAGARYFTGTIEGSFLKIPEQAFIKTDGESKQHKKYIVVQHEVLQYPIVVYRHSSGNYQALLMKCTHQGTELRVYGERLQCPAHGSEFTNTGTVTNGPADTSLRSFQVTQEFETLKINLS